MGNPYFTAVPEQVGVEITNRCDLACRHCFNNSGGRPVQELSIADLCYLFDQLQEMGIERIRISGGEPTLHPQFSAVVTEAYRQGLRVTINTHGLYSSQMRAKVAVLPIERFIVSLDGLRAVNDSIRGPGIFDRVIESAAWLLGMNRPVTLGVHLTRSAVGDIPGLIALAAELGAGIKFAPLRLMGRAAQYLEAEMLSPADFYRAVQTITRLRTEHPEIQVSTDMDILRPVEPLHPVSPSRASCPAGRTMLNVNYDGYVYPCAFLVTPGREFAAGHLHEASLLALWRDSAAFVPFRTLEKDAVCQKCFAYGQACVGGCVALSYLVTGRLDARDPTCFVDILRQRIRRRHRVAIEFKLRQEKRGGFLLDRRCGKAFELSQPQFDLLVALHSAGGVPADWPGAGLARYFGPDRMAGRQWWQSLAAMGLTDETGLKTLQLIPLVDDPARVPDDCLAAPARVYLEVTRSCNLSCRTCFNNSHRPLAGELVTGEILDLLDQLDRLGTFEIRFTGGEPTTHPDFCKIVSSARDRGFRVSLGTNGVYNDQVRSWIYESGVDWFIVSLDGMEEVNDWVRGPGTYRQVLRTLGELASHPQLHVRLNMVVARHNVHDIEPLARLADEYGVASLNMIPLRPYGRSAKEMAAHMFDQADFYSFIRQVQELRQRYRVRCITTLDLLDPEATTSHDPIVQKKRTCAAGVEAAVIGATGDVYGCSYSPASFPDSPDVEGRRLFVAGNARQASLHDIWRDSARWAVFRYLDVYKNQQCQTCPQYTVRCVGSCPIMGYFKAGHPDASDPYCFVDLASDTKEA